MSTTKDYKDYVLNQLEIMDGITCKSMMGEYLLYYKDVLFGGIYDNRVLVKIVSSNDLYNLSSLKYLFTILHFSSFEYLLFLPNIKTSHISVY